MLLGIATKLRTLCVLVLLSCGLGFAQTQIDLPQIRNGTSITVGVTGGGGLTQTAPSNVGTTVGLTTCPSGQTLLSNGSTYSCATVITGATPGNFLLQSGSLLGPASPTFFPSSIFVPQGGTFGTSGTLLSVIDLAPDPSGTCPPRPSQGLVPDAAFPTSPTGATIRLCNLNGQLVGNSAGSGSPNLPFLQYPPNCTSSQTLQWNGQTWNCANLLTGVATGGGLTVTGTTVGMLTSCANNQILQWNGSAWVCASAGAGTITGATTGGGLVVTGTTLGMLTSCSNNQVLSWNGSSWICANVGTGTVTGSGTNLTVPIWTNASNIGNSIITQINATTDVRVQPGSNASTNAFAVNFSANATSTGCGVAGAPTIPSQVLQGGVGCTEIASVMVPGNNTNDVTAAIAGEVITPSSNGSEAIGGFFYVNTGTTSTLQQAEGVEAASIVTQSAVANYGVLGFAELLNNASPVTTPLNIGLYGHAGAVGANDTATLNAAVYADSPISTGGTLTKNYGVYVADQTINAGHNPTPFGIYVAGGGVTTAPHQFSTLPACSSTYEGRQEAVSDSATNAWGGTITGSGGFHVLAYCDGSAWTISAK